MILTVTMNPSVDMRFMVDEFARGGVFRSREEQQTAGGKGLNVTRVLSVLGVPVTATGLLGGSNGRFIRQQLDEVGISHSFVDVAGNSRCCIAVLDGDCQTEVLGMGPSVSDAEEENFFNVFAELAAAAKVVTISGSLPPGMAAGTYRRLIALAKEQGCRVLLDTSGEPLLEGIGAGPCLVKPNRSELEWLAGKKLESEEDLFVALAEIGDKVSIAVVSLGAAGALALADGVSYRIRGPLMEAVNPVGSGDAMLAGMARGLVEKWALEKVFAYGAACGAANALEKMTGYVDPVQVEAIAAGVSVEKIESKSG